MRMTRKPPTGTGYFWWTNGGEHTPTILFVKKSHCDGSLYADNGEYSFEVEKTEDPDLPSTFDIEWGSEPRLPDVEGRPWWGASLWSASPIELPEINGEVILPDSY